MAFAAAIGPLHASTGTSSGASTSADEHCARVLQDTYDRQRAAQRLGGFDPFKAQFGAGPR